MTTDQPRRHRRKSDRARTAYAAIHAFTPQRCDTRAPGCQCFWCYQGPDDQPISANRALASNA